MATVFVSHELQCNISDIQRITVEEGTTLAEVAKEHNLNSYLVNVGGGVEDFVMDEDWDTPIADDSIVIFVNVPKGGDSDVISFIVSIAIIFVTPWASVQIFGEVWGAGRIALSITAIGLQMAAASLLPSPREPNKLPDPSPQYSARVETNIARLGEPVPVQFGRIPNALPDLVAAPYYEYLNSEQYIFLRYCLGMGKFAIHEMRFLHNSLESLATSAGLTVDDIVEIIPPSGSGTLLPANTFPAVDIAGGDMTENWSTSAFSCPVGEEVDTIDIDFFLNGLCFFQANGGLGQMQVAVHAQCRLVDDNDVPLGAGTWTTFLSPVIDSIDGDHEEDGGTINPIRKTYSVTNPTTIPKGRHEVQVRRNAPVSTDRRIRHDVAWGGMRGKNNDYIVLDDRTLINVKLKITEGSSSLIGDVLKNFTVNCTALNSEYNGTTWDDDIESRSVPWAFAKAFRDPNLGNRDVGRLWLDDLLTLHNKLETLNHHFDYRFDQKISLQEALDFIVMFGRSVVVQWAGTFVVIRDEVQTAYTHVFQPENCRNFTLIAENVQSFDHVIVTYSDPVTGQPAEAIFAPVASPMITPNRVPFLGCYSRQHALSQAEYFYYANKETLSATLESNNLKKAITFGASVLVPQTRRIARQFGVVKKRVGNTITLSSPHGISGAASLAFDDGANYVITLDVASVVDDNTVVVEDIATAEAAQGVNLTIIDSYQTAEPTAYLLQDAIVSTRVMRVKSIGGESGGWRSISLISAGVAEPVIDPNEDDNNDTLPSAYDLTITSFIVSQLVKDSTSFTLKCIVSPKPDAESYICQISLGTDVWRTVYTGAEPSWEFDSKPAVLNIRVAARAGNIFGAWSLKTVTVGDPLTTPPLDQPTTLTGDFDENGNLVMEVSLVLAAASYQWEIYDTADLLTNLHTHETGNKYTYTLARNITDGGARRNLTVYVYAMDAAGNLSDVFVTGVFSKAQSGTVTNISVVSRYKSILLTWTSSDSVLVYGSQTSPVPTTVGTELIDTKSDLFSHSVDYEATWYYVLAAYDVLGQDNMVYSAEYSATGGGISADDILGDIQKTQIVDLFDPVVSPEGILDILHIPDLDGDHIAFDSISADHIQAGAVVAEKMAIGTAPNMLAGSNFDAELTGRYDTLLQGLGDTENDYIVSKVDKESEWNLVGGQTIQIREADVDATVETDWADLWATNQETGEGYYQCVAGERYQFTVYALIHRCSSRLILDWYDKSATDTAGAPTWISQSATPLYDENVSGITDGKTLDKYERLTIFATAPSIANGDSADAYGVLPAFRKYGTLDSISSPSNSNLMLTLPFLGWAFPNQVDPSPWSEGGFTVIKDGSITTNKIVTGAIQANHIDAGQVTAQKIASGAVLTDALGVGSQTNIIPNSSFDAIRLLPAERPDYGEIENWFVIDNQGIADDYTINVDEAGKTLLYGHTAALFQDGTDTAGGLGSYDLIPHNPDTGGNPPTFENFNFPAQADQRYQASVYVGSVNCDVTLYLIFRTSASGNPATWAIFNSADQDMSGDCLASDPFYGGSSLRDDYKRLWVFGDAPADVESVSLFIRKLPTSSGLNSTMYATLPYLAEAYPNQSEPSNYGVGGAVTIKDGVITAPKIEVGAVTTEKIDVGAVKADQIHADAVTTDKILAGAVTAEKLTVGSSANFLPNSNFEAGVQNWGIINSGSGWDVGGAGTILGEEYPNPTYQLLNGKAAYVQQNDTGSITTGAYTDIHPKNPEAGDSNKWPVEGGVRYQLSAYVVAHRCKIQMYVQYFDASDTLLGTGDSDTYGMSHDAGDSAGAASALSDYTRVWTMHTAHIDAVYCRFILRKWANNGTNTSSFVFFTRCFLGEALPNQLEPSAWSAGGAVTIKDGSILAIGGTFSGTLTAGTIITDNLVTTSSVVDNAITSFDYQVWASITLPDTAFGFNPADAETIASLSVTHGHDGVSGGGGMVLMSLELGAGHLWLFRGNTMQSFIGSFSISRTLYIYSSCA